MKSIAVVLLMAVLPLVSCSNDQIVPEPEEPIGVFVAGPCPMPVPEGLIEGESVKCGTITVPERHGVADGKTLRLSAAVFPSISDNPLPDPLFVATAGPGASGLESITPEVAGPLGAALLAERDFVLIDYRGLPLAEPNLLCPEIVEAAFDDLGEALSGEQFMIRQIERSLACRDRLRAQGVDLEAFNNIETAADIAMVMTALGYDTFNVYGTSAGTILAQHLLRDFPERLRSVMIDSVVPAGRSNVHIEAPTISAQMLTAVVELCATDPACAADYPNLKQETEGLIDLYDQHPVTLEVTHPSTGEPMPLVLTGHRVAQALLMLNSQTPTVPLIPWFIHRLANGDTEIVNDFLWTIAPPAGNFSWALGTAIFCTEYGGFTEEEIVFPGILPAYETSIATQGFGAATLARTCAQWALEPVEDQFKQPVRSAVPVLVMAGQLDSLTPPSWAEEVAEGLTHAQVFEVRGYAHSPTFAGDCPARMGLQFLADPGQALDATCLADLEIGFVGADGPQAGSG